MTEATKKVRCPVCADSVKVDGGHLAEHKHKSSSVHKCYGSHMPVYEDSNGFTANTLIYAQRARLFLPAGNRIQR
jgi:hypothetical protein